MCVKAITLIGIGFGVGFLAGSFNRNNNFSVRKKIVIPLTNEYQVKVTKLHRTLEITPVEEVID